MGKDTFMNEQQSGRWPAFPGQARDAQGKPTAEYADGLTKRELFAAMAMQGMLANSDGGDRHQSTIAAYAVSHADALLTALLEGQKP